MRIKRNKFQQIKGTCGFFAFVEALCELSNKEYTLSEKYKIVYYLLKQSYANNLTFVGEIFHPSAFYSLIKYAKEYSDDFASIELSICQWQGEFPVDDTERYLVPISFFPDKPPITSHYLMLTPDRYWESNRGWHNYHEPDDKYPNSREEISTRNIHITATFDWAEYLSSPNHNGLYAWLDTFCCRGKMQKEIFRIEMQNIEYCREHIADLDNSMPLSGICIKLEKPQK